MFDVLFWIYIHDMDENIPDHYRNSATFGIPCICLLEGALNHAYVF